MANRRKGLILILDGLGDRPSPELAGLTPLEAASTPNLDYLTAGGICGLVDPLSPGVPVGTHTGTAILLGLAPRNALALARGPVEAAGIGLDAAPGDVLLRCNFATVERRGSRLSILDRRAGRIRERTHELAAAIDGVALGQGQIQVGFRPATQHRAVLRLRGPNLSPKITDTDPGSRFAELGVLESHPSDPASPSAAFTASVLNELTSIAHALLTTHAVNRERSARGSPPANGIICRSPGLVTPYRTIVGELGLKAAVVAGERTVLGLARMFQYNPIVQAGFTSLPNTDIDAKISAALTAAQDHDLIFLHIKGPDICAHDLDPNGKKNLIERVDKAIAPLVDLSDPELVIGVTGDHSTDSNTGRHSGDPVPSLLYAPLGRRDAQREFGEQSCMSGGMGRISGAGFLCGMLDAMNLLPNYSPALRPYV